MVLGVFIERADKVLVLHDAWVQQVLSNAKLRVQLRRLDLRQVFVVVYAAHLVDVLALHARDTHLVDGGTAARAQLLLHLDVDGFELFVAWSTPYLQVEVVVNLLERLLDDDARLFVLRDDVVLDHLEFALLCVRTQQRNALAIMRDQVLLIVNTIIMVTLRHEAVGFSEHISMIATVILALVLLLDGRIGCQIRRSLVREEPTARRDIHALILASFRRVIQTSQAESVSSLKITSAAVLLRERQVHCVGNL